MKRSFLAVTALLFVCAFAIVIFGARSVQESRRAVPTFCERKTVRTFELPDWKRLLPHVKR